MAQTPRSLPASVYWRRRLTVLGGLLVVIVIVVLIFVAPGFGGTSPTEDTTAEEALELALPPACLPSQVELTALTDQSTYNAGILPQLWLSVKNISAVECSLSVGTDVQRYVVTSGEEEYWASDDCQTIFSSTVITLTPGQEQSTTSLSWDRTRSAPETCQDVSRPGVPGGGASYHLRVYLGDLQSKDTKQFLLN